MALHEILCQVDMGEDHVALRPSDRAIEQVFFFRNSLSLLLNSDCLMGLVLLCVLEILRGEPFSVYFLNFCNPEKKKKKNLILGPGFFNSVLAGVVNVS